MSVVDEREQMYWNALGAPDAAHGRAAAHALSALLCQRGERAAAERVLRDCLQARGPEGSAGTWLRLARLLLMEGRCADGEVALAQALRLASVEGEPEVVVDLAAHWAGAGETERALGLYEQVANRAQERDPRAFAAYRLAGLVGGLGCGDDAVLWLRRALADAPASLSPFVLVDLAERLRERGELVEAADMYGRAIASDHPDQAPRAALALARLRDAEHDRLEAFRLLQQVVESGHPEFVPAAAEEKERLVKSEVDQFLSGIQAPATAVGSVVRTVQGMRAVNFRLIVDKPVIEKAKPLHDAPHLVFLHHRADALRTQLGEGFLLPGRRCGSRVEWISPCETAKTDLRTRVRHVEWQYRTRPDGGYDTVWLLSVAMAAPGSHDDLVSILLDLLRLRRRGESAVGHEETVALIAESLRRRLGLADDTEGEHDRSEASPRELLLA